MSEMTEIQEGLSEIYGEGLMFLEPGWQFDRAIVGVAERCAMEHVVVYDRYEIIEALIRDGLDEEEAVEFYEFNILGAYAGERSPMYIDLTKEKL